jgi:hypothetical protein
MHMLNLSCEYGDFDIMFRATGIRNYHDLEKRSLTVVAGTTETQIAAVEDIAESKRAAGRVKDLKVLQIFEKFLKDRDRDAELGR